mmetsp:Transcript_16590/g.56566  ORF Transcript_16590/g.56566 Transcript_16590/m.56566 type:complete len:445 (-) Transcript_16590:505-1839(-)
MDGAWGLAAAGGAVRTKKKRTGPCDHCGEKESTQWRVGPTMAPTLCNACGVHWGRKKKLPVARTEADKARGLPRKRALLVSVPDGPGDGGTLSSESGAVNGSGAPAAATPGAATPALLAGAERSRQAAAALAPPVPRRRASARPAGSSDDSEAAGILISLAHSGSGGSVSDGSTHGGRAAKRHCASGLGAPRRQASATRRESSPEEVSPLNACRAGQHSSGAAPSGGVWKALPAINTSRSIGSSGSGFRVVTPTVRPLATAAPEPPTPAAAHPAGSAQDGAADNRQPAAHDAPGTAAAAVQHQQQVQQHQMMAAQAALCAASAPRLVWPGVGFVPSVGPVTAFEVYHQDWVRQHPGQGVGAWHEARSAWEQMHGENKMAWHRRANASVAASCAAPLMRHLPAGWGAPLETAGASEERGPEGVPKCTPAAALHKVESTPAVGAAC